MCKANSAAFVKEKAPHLHTAGRRLSATVLRIYSQIAVFIRLIRLTARLVCGIINSTYVPWRWSAVKSRSKPPKVEALLEEGTLNPTPEEVRDPKFQDNEFFDPHDIVQVKYEMLRCVSVENVSVSAATGEYGVSRPTYYQTKAHFDKAGVAGLVPQKRGPRGPHKLRGEALAFVQQQLVAGQPLRARELAKLVRQKFDLNVHPRTIERAVAVKKTPR